MADFTRIASRDSVDVNVRVGGSGRVQVRAGEEVIDDVRTEVRNGTLHLSFDQDGIGDSNVVVEADVPKLDGIEASGSGATEADGIAADGFEVRSDGSGDLELRGRTQRLAADLDGSGDADLADLAARQVRVVKDGSGDAQLRAGNRLEVSLAGSGDVSYHGALTLVRRDDGSGELTRAD